jgi:hypothetical protein
MRGERRKERKLIPAFDEDIEPIAQYFCGARIVFGHALRACGFVFPRCSAVCVDIGCLGQRQSRTRRKEHQSRRECGPRRREFKRNASAHRVTD